MNFDKYLFHASGLSKVMTNGRSKKDPLSETAKGYLHEIYVKEKYGREKIEMLMNKYTRKGVMVETDSISLFEKLEGKTFFKNQKTISNKYVCGTPDIITSEEIIDIKSSWDLFTFLAVTEKKALDDYYWQLVAYMWLTDTTKARLVYVLSNTPETMISDELYRLSFYIDEEQAEKYRINYEFDDILDKDRVKVYLVRMDKDLIPTIEKKIALARTYLNSLSQDIEYY